LVYISQCAINIEINHTLINTKIRVVSREVEEKIELVF